MKQDLNRDITQGIIVNGVESCWMFILGCPDLLVTIEFSFQQTVIDFFEQHSRNYVMYADQYTDWVEVTLMSIGKARAVIKHTENLVLHIWNT